MRTSSRWRVKLRVLAALASTMVLVTTGYGWSAYRDLSAGMTRSTALQGLGSFASRPSQPSDSENILIMGLDSRLDQNGNPLPAPVLAQLHAGDSSDGGYNTNVLMVLHVPGQGEAGRAQAVSIPRDDYVSLPGSPDGQDQAKIKEGYGLAKAQAERRLRSQGAREGKELEQLGREAGRKQTIADVQNFLNISIDHFVEVTLVGFYDLAQALGSITVCLTGPTQDSYSGARFYAGEQRLDAAQALAFVRQRRDYVNPGLGFTDLDRARRQQAFLASAAYELKSAGTLTNPARLAALINVVKKDVVIDQAFDPLGFSTQRPDLLDGQISFTTLPVTKFATVNGQAVNLVDKRRNQAVVRQLFDPAAPPDTTPGAWSGAAATLDIVNAAGRDGLAAQAGAALRDKGFLPGTTRTQPRLANQSSLDYAPDSRDAATNLAELLEQPPPRPDPRLAPGHIRLILGEDFQLPTDTASEPDDAADKPLQPAPPAVPSSSISAGGIPCVK